MGKDFRDVYRSHRTCVLQIPLFHLGIYSILATNFFVALLFGITTFVGPGVLSLFQVKALSIAFGTTCFVVAAVQIFVFLSVHQNEHLPFRHFASISLFLFAICLVFALVFIILTATHPAVSQAQCLGALRPANPSNGGGNLVGGSSNQDKVQMASNVCSIFAKIQLGVMSGVWLLVLLVQIYFALKQRVYFQLKAEDAREDAVA